MKTVRVLVIEDDPWLGKVFERALKKDRYKVRVVAHGMSALDMVDKFMPDVIVSDILLAGGTVFALLHELQSYSDTGFIPVILCSNVAEMMHDIDPAAYGIREVFDKATVTPDALGTAIKRVLP